MNIVCLQIFGIMIRFNSTSIIKSKKKGGGAMRNQFGFHPNALKNFDKFWKEAREKSSNIVDFFENSKVKLDIFKDERHADAYLIPRDVPNSVVDECGDPVSHMTINIPFSSYNIYLDVENERSVFYEIYNTPAIWRLGGVSQLGYLIPPPDEGFENKTIYYLPNYFPHTRWGHSMLVAALVEIVLARNGFTKEERAPVLLAFASHDIATPAGGDSVMRIDKKELDEENNFNYVLERDGLDRRWKEKFGFDLAAAQEWIKGKGVMGSLLNVIDRIAYVALDCYYFGHGAKSKTRRMVSRLPLIMDVWQDIVFTADKKRFYFRDTRRLYDFLKLRMLEHTELLLNPRSRALDHTLFKALKGLYENREISKEDLLYWNDDILNAKVMEINKTYPRGFLTPDKFEWKFFQSQFLMERFSDLNRERISHIDRIKKVDVGFDWPVLKQSRVVEIKKALPQKKFKKLDSIANSLQGWYVYLYKK
jgi:HD superfamily phosphohydrolase